MTIHPLHHHCEQLVPPCKHSPQTIYSNSVTMDGPPGPHMADTDGLPLSQLFPQYFSVIYNLLE